MMGAISVVTDSMKACTFEDIIRDYYVTANCIILAEINQCSGAVIYRAVGTVAGKVKLYLFIEEIFVNGSICRSVKNTFFNYCTFCGIKLNHMPGRAVAKTATDNVYITAVYRIDES